MKIAIWYNLPGGGAKRALYSHVKGLIKRGHTVTAWSPPIDDDYLPLSNIIIDNKIPFNYIDISATNILSKIEKTTKIYSNYKSCNIHCQISADQINISNADVFIAYGCYRYKIPPIGKYINIPKIIYLQEPNRDLYEAKKGVAWMAMNPLDSIKKLPKYIIKSLEDIVKIKHYRWCAREEYYNILAFDTILVNSLFSRESVLRAYGVDAKVCYLGIDQETFHKEDITKENILISMGEFIQEKNPLLLLQAIAKLNKPKPKLIWVANRTNRMSSEYKNEVHTFIKKNDIDFELWQNVSDVQLRILLNKAKVFIYAPRLEPFGLSPLEANACGTPVVAVAEGGLRETIVNEINGYLVENDPQAMANAIDHILTNNNIAKVMSEKGIDYINKYWSLDHSIENLEIRIREAIS